MEIRKMCIIASYYPTAEDPVYSFLDEVVCEFADNGVECHVITPVSIFEKKHIANDRDRRTKQGNIVHIYCPRYYVVPSRKIGNRNTVRITGLSYYHSVYKAFKKHIGDCDMLYAHFLSLAGIAASMLGKRLNIPCVVACGESSFEPVMQTYHEFRKEIENISGFVAVSSKIKKELTALGFVKDSNRAVILPNAVDRTKFHSMDRKECRKEIGVPEDKFIIVFVGHFIERKGINMVIDVVNSLDHVYAIFVGDKELPKSCDKALFVGKVSHDRLPLYLNAADAFVLPTHNEGCCNAILEAQACGLPIVSSDAEFNYDILDKNSALLVNPDSEEEIRRALTTIYKDEAIRRKLSIASDRCAQGRGIQERVCSILSFLGQVYERK